MTDKEFKAQFQKALKDNDVRKETAQVLVGLCSNLKDPRQMLQYVIDECNKKTKIQDILDVVLNAVKKEKNLDF